MMHGKQVLITGAGKRLGAAMATAFAAAGARVILHAFSSAPEAETLAASLPGGRAKHLVVTADLADKHGAGKIFDALKDIELDILVNNAALYSTGGIWETSPEDYANFMQVNFFSPLELMRLFAQSSTKRERAIVNIIDAALDHTPFGAYRASKEALKSATIAAAAYLGRSHGIRVNGVAPGPVLAVDGIVDPLSKSRRTSVLGRVAEVSDIADAVVYVAGNKALTGVILPVDGGYELGKRFPE